MFDRGIDAKILDSKEDRGSEVLQMKLKIWCGRRWKTEVSKKTKFDFN